MFYRIFAAIIFLYLSYIWIQIIITGELVFDASVGVGEVVAFSESPIEYCVHLFLLTVILVVLGKTAIYGMPDRKKRAK